MRQRIVTMAVEVPELRPRELATRFTDAEPIWSRNRPSIACSRPMT